MSSCDLLPTRDLTFAVFNITRYNLNNLSSWNIIKSSRRRRRQLRTSYLYPYSNRALKPRWTLARFDSTWESSFMPIIESFSFNWESWRCSNANQNLTLHDNEKSQLRQFALQLQLINFVELIESRGDLLSHGIMDFPLTARLLCPAKANFFLLRGFLCCRTAPHAEQIKAQCLRNACLESWRTCGLASETFWLRKTNP